MTDDDLKAIDARANAVVDALLATSKGAPLHIPIVAGLLVDVPALVAEVRRARAILTAIIYASDGCVGHKDCNHSIKPWKDAREFLGLLREGEVVPPT